MQTGFPVPVRSTTSISPQLSKPEYKIRKDTVMIPMRDGVKLATDIYFPVNNSTQWPVILRRTPYNKSAMEFDARYYATRGYVVAVQDCRGLFASEGVWEAFVNEPEDGYDTIEWLGTREWSSGKVGMMGLSYQGWVQLWAAGQKPPHLVTIIPSCSPADPFGTNPFSYGIFMLPSIDLIQIFDASSAGSLSPKIMRDILYKRHDKVLNHLPVIDIDKKVMGKENQNWRTWIEHNEYDAYWERTNILGHLKDLDLPVFLQTGWFDLGVGSTWLLYKELKQSHNKFQKIIIGPWGHTDRSSSKWENYDFGKEAAPNLQKLFLRWFDYWLKGIDNKITEEPLVDIFVMFSNTWLKGDTYPLPETKPVKLYLSSKGNASTSLGDGKLVFSLEGDDSPFDQYTYDPGNPTPYPNYYALTLEEQSAANTNSQAKQRLTEAKQVHHREISKSRKDILVYQSAPLTKPISIAGPVSAVLYASTSAVDTDWVISFMDVDENGQILNLAVGSIRARFRNSMRKPELLEKNKVYRYDIDLSQTAITFQRNHRIRIEVASSFYPILSRNLNTGGHNEMETDYVKAQQKIFHSKEYPSHILLPVVLLQDD
jgi:putative CocE/NonD family hydrolase